MTPDQLVETIRQVVREEVGALEKRIMARERTRRWRSKKQTKRHRASPTPRGNVTAASQPVAVHPTNISGDRQADTSNEHVHTWAG